MKIITKILLIIGVTFLVSSCSLKEEPYGFLSTNNFYKTAADAEAATIDCYSNLGDVGAYSRFLFYVASYPSGEFNIKSSGGVDGTDLVGWTTNPNNQILFGIFQEMYLCISRSNAVITNVPSITMDTVERNQCLGEAYFLRALSYFNLVRLFGEVPLRTSVVNSASEMCIQKSPISTIYSLIVSDLKKASTLMTVPFTNGRTNAVAANALLSKVYLHMASSSVSGASGYTFVSNSDSCYSNAAFYASKVLSPTQTTYTFWNGDLRQLWSIANQLKNEFIFSIAFSKTGAQEGQYSKAQKNWTPYINGGLISLGPNYTAQIPDGWAQCMTNPIFYNTFSTSDLRRNAWIVNEVKDNTGALWTYPSGVNLLEYPFPIKEADSTATSDPTGHYVPVLRYSDILLVYAEAVGPTAQGYAAINQIRTRAGLPNLTSSLSLAAFRDSVVLERSWELCFEQNRLFDLRRTNTVTSVLSTLYGKTLDSHVDFYDIPLEEQETNPCVNQ